MIQGEAIRTQVTRMLADKEKNEHVVEERYTPLQDTEVEDLIDEAETLIKVARI